MPSTVVSLRLPTDIYGQLQALAAQAGKDVAQVIRELVATYIAQEEVAPLDDPAWHIAEIVERCPSSGLKDGSVNLDKYLYGKAAIHGRGATT